MAPVVYSAGNSNDMHNDIQPFELNMRATLQSTESLKDDYYLSHQRYGTIKLQWMKILMQGDEQPRFYEFICFCHWIYRTHSFLYNSVRFYQGSGSAKYLFLYISIFTGILEPIL